MANRKYTYLTGVAVSSKLLDAEGDAHPTMVVTLRVTEGDRAGEEMPYYGSFHPKAAEYTIDALRNMGWRGSDITAQPLEGLGTVQCVIGEYQDEYKGRKSTKYTVFQKAGKKEEMTDEKRAAFAEKFKALAASKAPVAVTEANKAPEKLPEAKVATAKPMASANDSLPF
jgi:hypothetical protein